METQRLQRDEHVHVPCFLNNISIIAGLWGIITVAMIWGSFISIIQENKGATFVGWYMVAIGILVLLLELIWLINRSACCSYRDGCCCRCWSVLMWLDNWKKGILYIVLAVPVFLENMRLILGIVSGFFLVILGLLYIVKTFEYGVIYTRQETRFVSSATPSTTSATATTVQSETSSRVESQVYYQQEVAETRPSAPTPPPRYTAQSPPLAPAPTTQR